MEDRALTLPGITKEEAAVVGAGAVVNHDVPDFTMMAGVPAREIRKLAKDQVFIWALPPIVYVLISSGLLPE